MTFLEEVLYLLRSEQVGKNRWGKRKFHNLTDEEKTEVLKEFPNLNTERPEPKESKPRTTLDWQELANYFLIQHRIDPTESFIALANKYLQNKNINKKILTFGQIQKSIDLYKSKLESLINIEEENKKLKNLPTQEEVIRTLTTEEIVRWILPRVVEELPAKTVLSYYEINDKVESVPVPELAYFLFQKITPKNETQKDVPQRSQPKEKQLKIVIVGLLAGQQNVIKNKFSNINFVFVDKNRGKDFVPQVFDYIILAVNFIDHGLQNYVIKNVPTDKIITQAGGIYRLSETIERLEKAFQKTGN